MVHPRGRYTFSHEVEEDHNVIASRPHEKTKDIQTQTVTVDHTPMSTDNICEPATLSSRMLPLYGCIV